MQNLQRVGKDAGPTLSRLWAKVHDMRRRRRPLVVSDALARLCRPIPHFVPKTLAVKFPLGCKIVQKGGFRPRFVGGIPQVSDTRFQIALILEHVAGFG